MVNDTDNIDEDFKVQPVDKSFEILLQNIDNQDLDKYVPITDQDCLAQDFYYVL